MNGGDYKDTGNLFGYASDMHPTEIDSVHVKFEGNTGGIIRFYADIGLKPVAEYNRAFPSAHFEEVRRFPGISQSNMEWVERQILQRALAEICGVEYVPNEDGVSFAKRAGQYEQRWKRQQC